MTPMRDLVLIELTDFTTEEKTESGIVLVKSTGIIENFQPDEDLLYENIHKKKWEPKDLANRLVEASKKGKGLIDTRDSNNKLQDDRIKNILLNRNKCSGIIRATGHSCKYYSEGDTVTYKGQTEVGNFEINNKPHVLVKESDILVKREGDKLIPHPDHVLIKITKESRDNIFKRQFTREDGTKGHIFIGVDDDSQKDRKATIYVSAGTVMSAGENVKTVQPGDLACVHYSVDNNDDIIIGYDGPDKLVVVDAVTTYHTDDLIIEANRKGARTQAAYLKGDYENISSLLGVIRDNELIAMEPFVFLNHESNEVAKVTRTGILYTEKQTILEREIIALSETSKEKFRLKKGDAILCHDYDTFSVMIDDKQVSCINDVDIMVNDPMRRELKATLQVL